MFDAALEGQRILAEAEAGVENPSGSIIQECQQHRLTPPALGVGHLHGVHAIDLHAFQGGKELKGQCLFLLVHSLASFSIQSRRAYEARQRGAGGVGLDVACYLQLLQGGRRGELGVGL